MNPLSHQRTREENRRQGIWRGKNGIALPVALAIITVLFLLGTTALMMTSTDLKIAGNYREYAKAA
ncbi:MAG TPA: pilus assembly PilX N-terminal domain-containing protein, partial [Syntrophales bacterium]|nr:pilus assembly PilX N-terminal domain-containing protein [Syntrophales bacterium]